MSYCGVTRLLQSCYRTGAWVLQNWDRSVSGILQICYRGVIYLLHECYRGCSREGKTFECTSLFEQWKKQA